MYITLKDVEVFMYLSGALISRGETVNEQNTTERRISADNENAGNLTYICISTLIFWWFLFTVIPDPFPNTYVYMTLRSICAKFLSRGFGTFFLFAYSVLSVFNLKAGICEQLAAPGSLLWTGGTISPGRGGGSYHRKWHMSVISVVYYVIVAGIYRHILLCMLLHITSVAFRSHSWPFKPLG